MKYYTSSSLCGLIDRSGFPAHPNSNEPVLLVCTVVACMASYPMPPSLPRTQHNTTQPRQQSNLPKFSLHKLGARVNKGKSSHPIKVCIQHVHYRRESIHQDMQANKVHSIMLKNTSQTYSRNFFYFIKCLIFVRTINTLIVRIICRYLTFFLLMLFKMLGAVYHNESKVKSAHLHGQSYSTEEERTVCLSNLHLPVVPQ